IILIATSRIQRCVQCILRRRLLASIAMGVRFMSRSSSGHSSPRKAFSLLPSFAESLMAPESEGDWGEYRRLILAELTRLSDGISEVKGQISVLSTAEIAVLKFQAGVWGFIAGAVPGAIALIYAAVKHP